MHAQPTKPIALLAITFSFLLTIGTFPATAAEVLPYSISTTNKEPIHGGEVPFGSMAILSVKYEVAEGQQPEPFRIRFDFLGLDWDKGVGTTFASVSGEDKLGKRLGTNIGAFLAKGKKLSGWGYANVYLIRDADEKTKDPKPISNTLKLKVEFSAKPSSP